MGYFKQLLLAPERKKLRDQRLIEDSIVVWESKLALTNDSPKALIHTLGWRNCPLCNEYFIWDCKGCPIMEKTGHHACENTPYNKVYECADKRARNEGSPEALTEAVNEELTFLKSLLTKEK